MVNNYTPINPSALEKKFHPSSSAKGFSIDTILLLIGTVTAIVLAFMLFVLIQKKMQSAQEASVAPPVVSPSIPKTSPAVSASPIPTIPVETSMPTIATVSATPSVVPTSTASANLESKQNLATPSATKSP